MIVRNGTKYTLTGWHAAALFAGLIVASFALGYMIGVV